MLKAYNLSTYLNLSDQTSNKILQQLINVLKYLNTTGNIFEGALNQCQLSVNYF